MHEWIHVVHRLLERRHVTALPVCQFGTPYPLLLLLTDGHPNGWERRKRNNLEKEVSASISCCHFMTWRISSLSVHVSFFFGSLSSSISMYHTNCLSLPSFNVLPSLPFFPFLFFPFFISYTGHMRFLGEIYMYGLVKMKVMKFCILELINSEEVSPWYSCVVLCHVMWCPVMWCVFSPVIHAYPTQLHSVIWHATTSHDWHIMIQSTARRKSHWCVCASWCPPLETSSKKKIKGKKPSTSVRHPALCMIPLFLLLFFLRSIPFQFPSSQPFSLIISP